MPLINNKNKWISSDIFIFVIEHDIMHCKKTVIFHVLDSDL